MNFQDLHKIESADYYIDVAFRKTSERITRIRKGIRIEDKIAKQKKIENQRIDILRDNFNEELINIIKAYPDFESLTPFYKELVKCTLDYVLLKKSLGALDWAIKKINVFQSIYTRKIKLATTIKDILSLRNQFYGRVASVIKQIKHNLAYLEEVRKIMKGFPSIKSNMFTVCIFGFPNVGKSTLLARLTTARPEINTYPFTTKTLNLGYIKEPSAQVQIIDTPGTLNRVDKMNNIELQAYLAVKYNTNLVVYVFDPTYEYDLEKQEKLLKRLDEFQKPILFYMSKSDLAEKENVEVIRKNHADIITDAAILREKIINLSKEKK